MKPMKIKKENEECDLGFGFDDTFKADNHILSIVSSTIEMIGGKVRNCIPKEAHIVLKKYRTLI